MEIIAHRGYWKQYGERNTLTSLKRARDNKIGVETDFRDLNNILKISHDIADETCPDAEDFFNLFSNTDYTLALNIKADGIQNLLKKNIEKYGIKNYFCFDMSIPDTITYMEAGLRFFSRESEYELTPILYEKADGIWIDAFESDDWITEEKISKYLYDDKKVCIVSPELHKRDYKKKWIDYKNMKIINNKNLILCTDYPMEARSFFNEQED